MASESQKQSANNLKKKRMRGINWDKTYEMYVIQRAFDLRHEIFGDNGGAKGGSGERGPDITNKAWDKIREGLLAGGMTQTRDQVKKKFNNIRTSVSSKKSEISKHNRGTGGGPAKEITFTEVENFYIQLFGTLANMKGIGGRPDSSRGLDSAVSMAVSDVDTEVTQHNPEEPPTSNPGEVVPIPEIVLTGNAAPNLLAQASTVQPIHAVQLRLNERGMLEHVDSTPFIPGAPPPCLARGCTGSCTEGHSATLDLLRAEPFLLENSVEASVPVEDAELPSSIQDDVTLSGIATPAPTGTSVTATPMPAGPYITTRPMPEGPTSFTLQKTPGQSRKRSRPSARVSSSNLTGTRDESPGPSQGESIFAQSKKATLNQLYKESLEFDIALKKQQLINLKLEEQLLRKQVGKIKSPLEDDDDIIDEE